MQADRTNPQDAGNASESVTEPGPKALIEPLVYEGKTTLLRYGPGTENIIGKLGVTFAMATSPATAKTMWGTFRVKKGLHALVVQWDSESALWEILIKSSPYHCMQQFELPTRICCTPDPLDYIDLLYIIEKNRHSITGPVIINSIQNLPYFSHFRLDQIEDSKRMTEHLAIWAEHRQLGVMIVLPDHVNLHPTFLQSFHRIIELRTGNMENQVIVVVTDSRGYPITLEILRFDRSGSQLFARRPRTHKKSGRVLEPCPGF